MDIYCTRLHCEQPLNSLLDLDDSKFLETAHQQHCDCCGMPLVLEGRYVPLKLLQRNELSTTFLGKDLHSDSLKHCKIEQIQLDPTFTASQIEIATKIFDREVKVLGKLGEHPNLPRLFDSLELTAPVAPDRPIQKFFYLVQEYIDGKTLETELLEKGQFTEAEVIAVLREVARILEFVHFQGAIHRNLKPAKILRDSIGKIYLVDFGLVKQLNLETIEITGDLSPRKSKSGFKLEYTLSNQYLKPDVYPSSDLYSLAVTCLNLLTGKQPQDLLNPETNVWQWRTPDLQVSDYLAEILDRMLKELPIDRFPAARDVLDALDASLGTPILSISNLATIEASANNASTLLLDDPYDDPFQQVDDHGSLQFEDDSFLRFEDDNFVQLDHDLFQIDERLVVANKIPVPAAQSQIQVISKINIKPKTSWAMIAMLTAGIAAISAIIIPAFVRLFEPKPTMSDTLTQDVQIEISRRSSVGERILVGLEGNRDTDKFKELKRAGVAAIANRNYPEAIAKLQAALIENPNSPETRIYLNNALVGDQKSYTIAAVAPIERSLDRAAEMLRGFAQAQAEINLVGDVNEAKIKLRIVDDSDDPRMTESIATAIGDRSEILGIVGHSRNDVTMKAAKIYNRKEIAFIAPISTAMNLTGTKKPYIFRTNNKGDAIAKQLVDHLIDVDRKQKIAIFYVPSIAYNNEFKNQFANQLKARGGKVVGAFPFSTTPSSLLPAATTSTFDAEAFLQKADQMGAEALLLLPVGRNNREAIKLLKIRANRYPKFDIVGDAALYNLNTLKSGDATAGLVLNVPWQESESTTQFSTGAKQLWNTQVNWATATSYNAVKALGLAIKMQESPSRSSVMQMLSKNEFMGASGRFQFKNGDPTGRNILVKVAQTPANYKYSSRTGYDFVPLE
jgi:ABC-type branched-subunit amino acid transport system substrate-binding protein/serine/threonine protein kinase